MIYYTTHLNENSTSEWVVFVHGAGGSSTIWYKQIKAFKAHFNILLVDLRGHGQNTVEDKINDKLEYSLKSISKEIIHVLDEVKIQRAHFIGVSLGTILIREIIESYPNRILKTVLTGTIIRLNYYSKTLITIGNATKKFVPFMLLYKIFAFVIMPRDNHKKSRNVFIQEAKKLKQTEFLRWFEMTKTLNQNLKSYAKVIHNLPVLYLMGRQDHLFVNDAIEMVKKEKNGQLEIIENCGHIVNIEQAELFNTKAIYFLREN
jgi:pimeloyl-ACP methyl ester carboxylesterase